MATKKTSAAKTTTKTATSKATKTAPSSKGAKTSDAPDHRALAHCPLPEHLRVDPESAQTEFLKSRLAPDAPLPVFSTRALEHGMSATGAAGLRSGFSWNSQMDLAWALGYPSMPFIVDGGLESDSKEGVLGFYGLALADLERASWYSKSADSVGLVPRRSAFAVLYELEHGKHPFGLPEKEFLAATEPRDLSSEDVRTLLGKITAWLKIERIALLLEALAGSAPVATVLCELLEARASDEGDNGKFRVELNSALMAVLRRLPSTEVSVLRKRGAPDARKIGLDAIAKGWIDSALTDLQWADDVEDEMLRSFKADCKEGIGDVPFPRYLFAGGEKLIKEQVALFGKYSDGPEVFFSQYSTVRHPLLTGPALLTRAQKDHREGMTLWFEKHAEFFRPLLEKLSKDAKLGKHASDVLKKL